MNIQSTTCSNELVWLQYKEDFVAELIRCLGYDINGLSCSHYTKVAIPRLRKIATNLYISSFGDVYACVWRCNKLTLNKICTDAEAVLRYHNKIYKVPYSVFSYRRNTYTLSKLKLICSTWYDWEYSDIHEIKFIEWLESYIQLVHEHADEYINFSQYDLLYDCVNYIKHKS